MVDSSRETMVWVMIIVVLVHRIRVCGGSSTGIITIISSSSISKWWSSDCSRCR